VALVVELQAVGAEVLELLVKDMVVATLQAEVVVLVL
jgi:hypothetical protein